MKASRRAVQSRVGNITVACSLVLCQALWPVGADARELSLQVSAGVGYTDNALRTPEAEKDETMGALAVSAAYVEKTPRLDARLDADLASLNYVDDTYDSEVIGDLIADANFAIVPGRIEWVLEDNFSQRRLDPGLQETPNNRESVNFLTTGPQMTLRLTSATYLQLAAQYGNVWYEESNFDNERYIVSAGLTRQLSAKNAISLNVGNERLVFNDESVGERIDLRSAVLTYQAEITRTQLVIEAGYNETRNASGDQEDDGVVGRIHLARQISPSMKLHLTAGVSIADAALALRDTQAVTGANLDTSHFDTLPTADVFELRSAAVKWEFSKGRTFIGASFSVDDESYRRESDLDRKVAITRLRYRRNLSRATSVRLEGRYADQRFEITDRSDREWLVGAGVARRLGQRLFADFQVSYEKRNSALTFTEYDEVRCWLNFGYTLGSLQ